MNDAALPPLERGKKVGTELALFQGGIVVPRTFGEVVDYAQMMAKGDIALPAHCRDKPGVCMAIIQQSLAWGFDPWAVARKTYSVSGVLAYEAQVMIAAIRKLAPVKEKVWTPVYTGEGQNRKCKITVHHKETGEEISYESPIIGPYVPGEKDDDGKRRPPASVVGIWPKNSPLWRTEPDQQLYYYSMRAMARRFFPEIILGVYDIEEARAMVDITPKEAPNFLEDTPENEVKEGEIIQPGESSGKHRNFAVEQDAPQRQWSASGAGVTEAAQPEPSDYAEPAKPWEPPEGQPRMRPAVDEEAHDPETGEILEAGIRPEFQPLAEEAIVDNMLKSIAGAYDAKSLSAITEAYVTDLERFKPENRKRVRKAIADREIDLEDL